MRSLETVRQLLRARGHVSLASLLLEARVEITGAGQYTRQWQNVLDRAEVHAPIPDYLQLLGLPEWAKDEILKTIREIWPPREHDIDITEIVFRPERIESNESITSEPYPLKEADWLETTLFALATSGPPFDSVSVEYKRRLGIFAEELATLGISNPVPDDNLLIWFARFSAGDFPTKESWRDHIVTLFNPLREQLRASSLVEHTRAQEDGIGWPLVGRQLRKTQSQLRGATHTEDFQVVGLLCRETIISTAQTVYDPRRHPSHDGTRPSTTDAKRMLDNYIAVELGGPSNDAARKYAKAALDLANSLQHKRTAGSRTAALCALATESAVNIIAILDRAGPLVSTEALPDHLTLD